MSSQRDAERADIGKEKKELAADPKGELRELAAIYRRRGLDADFAMKVAEQLSASRRLESHLRDELGLDQAKLTRPIQAALVSAASFASLGMLPIVGLLLAPASLRIAVVAIVCLLGLAGLGALGGHLGDAPKGRAALRVMVGGGGAAMAATAIVGHLLHAIGVG